MLRGVTYTGPYRKPPEYSAIKGDRKENSLTGRHSAQSLNVVRACTAGTPNIIPNEGLRLAREEADENADEHDPREHPETGDRRFKQEFLHD